MAQTGDYLQRLKAKANEHARRVTHLEQELQASLERYELVWQATNDILYDLDIPTGNIIWNHALYNQFGYQPDEPANTLEWWISHIHPDDALSVERGLDEWFSGNAQTWRSEYRFRKANGSYSDVLDSGYLMRDASGAPLRIIGTLFDLTQQKALNRAKDGFISLVSHQLRTPLTVIRVYGEMFAGGMFGTLSEIQAEHVARMTSASVRLIKLVDDILSVSRIELGYYEVSRTWVRIDSLIRHIVDEIKPFAADKHVTLSCAAAGKLPKLYTDADMLGHILENLISNAVRYTRPGRGAIAIEARRAANTLLITVADNGIGIPKAAQAHVFDRFYRAHNAINIEEHGTGLGLYLVQALTTKLGGRVWFESHARVGTTFYLSFPLD